MQIEGLRVFFGGMGGALLVELVKLVGWRNRDDIGERYKSGRYWIGTGALFLLSGLVAVWKAGAHASLEQAVQLGIDAPALVGGYATAHVSRRRRRTPEHFMAPAAGKPQEKRTLLELLAW